MPWPLRFRDGPEPWKDAEIGDCWYLSDWAGDIAPHPALRKVFLDHQASRQYIEQWADKRPPLIIRLPPGFNFSPDERYRGGQWGDNPAKEGWAVTGSAEDGTLTVSPSINVLGAYHGFVQNGVLGDDLEDHSHR